MLTSQTKSFFLVAFLAIATTYTALFLAREILPYLETTPKYLPDLTSNIAKAKSPVVVNSASWKLYQDSKYNLSFKYPSDWTINTYTSKDPSIGYIIVLNPNSDADHIRIYINNEGYFATSGLKPEKTKIAGLAGININDVLVGFKQGSTFYTFDSGTTGDLQPYFEELVKTIAVTK